MISDVLGSIFKLLFRLQYKNKYLCNAQHGTYLMLGNKARDIEASVTTFLKYICHENDLPHFQCPCIFSCKNIFTTLLFGTRIQVVSPSVHCVPLH